MITKSYRRIKNNIVGSKNQNDRYLMMRAWAVV